MMDLIIAALSKQRLLYSWEYSDPANSPHLLRFEASFSEQQLVHAELPTVTGSPGDRYVALSQAFNLARGC